MANSNHYQTLQVKPTATQAEIKQAYRQMAKRFHPDSNHNIKDSDRIRRINAAYEVLNDPQQRQNYDRQQFSSAKGKKNYKPQNQQYRRQGKTGKNADEHLQQWLEWVYVPVNRFLCRILNSLEEEIDELSADPFDDELLGAFQAYLEDCQHFLSQARSAFGSMPNPANLASVAAHLYYCLDRVGDGIEELNWFTLNYDEHYLHTGQELFRIASQLRQEALGAMNELT